MRKDIFLPSLALAGGVGGFFLRRWQLASAYRPEEGLFVHGAPATWALLGLIAILALAVLFLVQGDKEGPEDFLPAFGSPNAGYMTVLTAAFFLLLAAGGFGMQEGFRELQQWQSAPELYQLSIPGSQLLTGALCILAGFGVLFLGRMAYRGQLNDAACRMASLPAIAGVVWLFAAHLQNGTEPVLMKYGFRLAAICLLTLAHYYIAAFLFGRPRRRRTLFLSLLGAVLGLLSLADRPDFFTTFGLLAFSLSALGFAWALARNTFGPSQPKRLEGRMPPPEENSQTENPGAQTEI